MSKKADINGTYIIYDTLLHVICVKTCTVCVEFSLFGDCIFKNTKNRDIMNELT